jgi:hypothetical protein
VGELIWGCNVKRGRREVVSGILSRAVHEVAFPWAIRARTQTKIGLSQRNYGTLFHPKGDVEGSDPEIVVF